MKIHLLPAKIPLIASTYTTSVVYQNACKSDDGLLLLLAMLVRFWMRTFLIGLQIS